MAGWIRLHAEVFAGFDEALAKETLPLAVHPDAGGGGLGLVREAQGRLGEVGGRIEHGKGGHASAEGGVQGAAGMRVGQGRKVTADAVDDGDGLLQAHPGQRDEELFATIATDEVAGAQAALEQPGQRTDHLIAHRVAVGVVDGLEVVDVDQQQAQRWPTVLALQR